MAKDKKKSVKWSFKQMKDRARSASANRTASLALARMARGGYRYGHKATKRGGMRRRKSHHSRKHRRSQRGGYAQYQNNLPMTQTYATGGPLSPSNSALASPPPVTVLSNNASCVDNYNHYTNSGFPSRGH